MKPLGFYLGIVKDFGILRTLRLYRNAHRNIGEKDFSRFSIGYIELAAHCTQKCAGCYMESEKEDITTLDFDIADKFVKQLHDLGTGTYVFIGGEPLEDKTKNHVIKLIENNPADVFYVCTNGYGIDDSVSGRLSKSFNVVVALSIDGLEEKNDLRRGHGAFQTIVEASKVLRRDKLPLGAYVTINSINYEEISSKPFISHLISLGIKYANFQRHFPDDSGLCITDEEFVHSLRRLHGLAAKNSIILSTAYFGDLANPSLKNRHTPITIGRDGGIRAKRDGTSYGNLKELPLEKIVKNKDFIEMIRLYHDFEDTRDGDMRLILKQILSNRCLF